jgi:hypothetical protein
MLHRLYHPSQQLFSALLASLSLLRSAQGPQTDGSIKCLHVVSAAIIIVPTTGQLPPGNPHQQLHLPARSSRVYREECKGQVKVTACFLSKHCGMGCFSLHMHLIFCALQHHPLSWMAAALAHPAQSWMQQQRCWLASAQPCSQMTD